jgi:hypothetical protein
MKRMGRTLHRWTRSTGFSAFKLKPARPLTDILTKGSRVRIAIDGTLTLAVIVVAATLARC